MMFRGWFGSFNKFWGRIRKRAPTKGRGADRKHIKNMAEEDIDEVINEDRSKDEVQVVAHFSLNIRPLAEIMKLQWVLIGSREM
jgi:hypothetical protein